MQKTEITEACIKLKSFMEGAINLIRDNDYDKINDIIEEQAALIVYLQGIQKKQLKRLKKPKKASTKVTMLYVSMINETKSLALQVVNIVKAQRDFISASKS